MAISASCNAVYSLAIYDIREEFAIKIDIFGDISPGKVKHGATLVIVFGYLLFFSTGLILHKLNGT